MNHLKKIGVLISMIMLVVAIGGCGEKESAVPNLGDYSNFDTSWEKRVFVEDAVLNTPAAMVYVGDSLYVASREGHCVLKYSKEGVLEQTIGGIGNGEGEFRKPIAIAAYEDAIYVADENDGKVQVFNIDGTFRNQFYVEELDNLYVSVLDVEVDESNIYISVVAGSKKLACVYKVDKVSGAVDKVGSACMGTLGRGMENEIYFGQAYDYVEVDGSSGYESGNGYVAQIKEDKMKELFQLPDGYIPSDILIHNNEMYLFSQGITQVDIFDLNGQYLKTIFGEKSSPQNRGLGYITVDNEGNFYLSDQENNIIYKLEK